MRQNNMVIPPRTPTIEPTGGSDGTAATMEQAFTAHRNRIRAEQDAAGEKFPEG